MANRSPEPQTLKNELTNWVSRWTAFINRLHKQSLLVNCPGCNAEIELTRRDVDAHGITIYCSECEDHLVHRTPRQFLADLDAAGIPVDGGGGR